VIAIPELLNSAKAAILAGTMPNNRNEVWLTELVNKCWSDMLQAIVKEIETDVRVDMLGATKDMMESVGQVLSVDSLQLLVPTLNTVMDAAEERRGERQKRTAHEDFDEEEQAVLEEEQEMEEANLDAVQELLAAVLSTLKGPGLQLVEALLPKISRLMSHGRTPEEMRIAVCVFDDILEHAYDAGGSKFIPLIMPVLQKGATSTHVALRQSCTYAFGLIAHKEPSYLLQADNLGAQVRDLCLGMMRAPNARIDDDEMATDNAVSTLGKLIEYCPNALGDQAHHAALAYLAYLPLRGDESEGKVCHEQLQRLVESSNQVILGSGNAHLPHIVRAMVAVVSTTRESEGDALEAHTRTRMCAMLRTISQGISPDMYQGCLQMLGSDVLKSNLAAIVAERLDQVQVVDIA
jgi:importin-5